MSSWYVENECIPVNQLQPIWFIVLTSIIQIVIALIIAFVSWQDSKSFNDAQAKDIRQEEVYQINHYVYLNYVSKMLILIQCITNSKGRL